MAEEYFIGFDIGGSSVKAALVANKKILKSETEFLPGNLEDLLALLVKMKNKLIEGFKPQKIKGVGFALAGELDKKREIMLESPNISFLNGQPLKKMFKEKFSPFPVKLEHDVYCFLLAEKEIGVAKNFKDVFYLTLGTGIGSALMIGGKIIKGAHGAAGEAGHAIIDITDNADLEDIASNKIFKKMLGLSSLDSSKKMKAGDKKAREVFDQMGKNLGVGLANIINILDPEAVIMSGGIARDKDVILPGIKEEIDKHVVSPEAKKTKILFSELGREGGAIGAALLFER